ncbi:MAG: response regulator [Bacteroidetes bacterium]|nr:response regulator [Bacteroidota bacterium]
MNEQPLRVLVVDDEPQIRRFLRAALAGHSYRVVETGTGADALVKAATEHPHLVILDLGLPDTDGIDVLRRLREWSSMPVIVLSVRGREEDKIRALDEGADDYVTKPFNIGELLARVRAALRHHLRARTEEPVYRAGGLTVDLARRLVTMNGVEVKLAPKEYELLHQLVVHAGKVLTHQHLLREVWGPMYAGETHYLRVHIGTLRKKIEPDVARPRYITTEPGVGYRMVEGEESSSEEAK